MDAYRDSLDYERETLRRLLKVTRHCDDTMHEPDLECEVTGQTLDNAFGNDPSSHEFVVTLTYNAPGEKHVARFNLADLIALARMAYLK